MRTERLPERAHPGSLAIVGGRIRADCADVEGISSLAAPTECRLVIRNTSVPVAKVEDRHQRERRCLLRQVLSENLDDTISQLVQVQRLFVRQDHPRVRLAAYVSGVTSSKRGTTASRIGLTSWACSSGDP